MRRIFALILILITGTAGYCANMYYEKDYQKVWCNGHNGSMEVVLPDKARVDCVTKTHAIEFDFAKKWGESIGQALYYAAVLNKKAGIVLILENGTKDEKYLNRVNEVAKLYNISVWTMTPTQIQQN